MRALVAGLLLVLVQPIQPEPGVSGYVLAPDGTPVSSGTVVARFGFTSATTSIERTGRFRMLLPRSGSYELDITVPGFARYRLSVGVPTARSLRLPVIRLSPGSYFRVRLVTPTGEPIVVPLIRRRMFDASGTAIVDSPTERPSDPADADGAVMIGPLPLGTLTTAVDMPLAAQTRLPDVVVADEGKILDGGTIVIQQPGGVLNVDLVDGAGAPVPNQYVFLDDARPRSPLVFRSVETDQHGRATFDRLAAGRYRVEALAVDRCANARLRISRDVPVSGTGIVDMRLAVGGRASFRISSPLGPVRGAAISAAPDGPQPPTPLGGRPSPPACVGVTDGDGRVTLSNFPAGPARIDVRLANSTYERRVDVPPDLREIAINVPDGFLPVRIVNRVTKQAVSGATITWTGSGGRAEATATAAGEALLEGVGTGPGTLVASARGYEDANEPLTEPPGVPHTMALTPAPPTKNVTARVTTIAGEPLANAVVELVPNNGVAPRVAVTGSNGTAVFAFSGAGQIAATADGFVPATLRIGPDPVVFTLARGYRLIAAVELPASAGLQRVRVIDNANRAMDDSLDIDSDRAIEPPGRLTIGPLAPEEYLIVLDGASGRHQARVRIVDRDAVVTVR